MAIDNMDAFFTPNSVAIVGASRNTKKIGHVVLRNFVTEFKGEIYPVNPNAQSILGMKCYPGVRDIPHEVDQVVICVHADYVPEIMRQCAEKHVKAVIIISGGFGEVGRHDLEEEVKKIAEDAGIRIIGPNCVGCFDAYSHVDSVFLPAYRLGRPPKGNISLISQSGALGGAMLDWAKMSNYGFSKFVSYGNALDVDEADLIEYLGKDRKTKLICVYLEGVKEGRKFLEVAREVTKKKPIIAIKGGVTEAGGRAVGSHTGSLAGSAKVYEAAFKQADIIQAKDLQEMLDFARTMINSMIPKGPRVQVITNGGGLGVLSTDAIEKDGLELAKMDEETVKKLKEKFPKYVVVANPIDLTGDADTQRYSDAIDAALNDDNVDIILIDILFQVPTLTSDIVEVISEKYNLQKKPILVCCLGGEYTVAHKKAMEQYKIPTFSYPESAVKAIKCLFEQSENLKD